MSGKGACECDGPAVNTHVDGNEGHNPFCPAHPRNRPADEGGTIRSLHGGRVIGKTENLFHTFAEAVTRGGAPCLIVGPEDAIDRLDPYLPDWVERLIDNETPRGIVYAFSMTLEEWTTSTKGATP